MEVFAIWPTKLKVYIIIKVYFTMNTLQNVDSRQTNDKHQISVKV